MRYFGLTMLTGLLVLSPLRTVAEPTEQDYFFCHELVSEQLLKCLNDSPGKLELICLDQSRIMLKACYNQVRKSAHLDDPQGQHGAVQRTASESGRP